MAVGAAFAVPNHEPSISKRSIFERNGKLTMRRQHRARTTRRSGDVNGPPPLAGAILTDLPRDMQEDPTSKGMIAPPNGIRVRTSNH